MYVYRRGDDNIISMYRREPSGGSGGGRGRRNFPISQTSGSGKTKRKPFRRLDARKPYSDRRLFLR